MSVFARMVKLEGTRHPGVEERKEVKLAYATRPVQATSAPFDARQSA
jgi:hypothetical protein